MAPRSVALPWLTIIVYAALGTLNSATTILVLDLVIITSALAIDASMYSATSGVSTTLYGSFSVPLPDRP
jgi:hypothetical protein